MAALVFGGFVGNAVGPFAAGRLAGESRRVGPLRSRIETIFCVLLHILLYSFIFFFVRFALFVFCALHPLFVRLSASVRLSVTLDEISYDLKSI